MAATAFVCDGTGVLMNIRPEPAGATCPSGGYRIEVGIDGNGDGALSPDEVDTSSNVCHGVDAASYIVGMSEEPAGDNCTDGGQKIETGFDIDGDGILDHNEVAATAYVCNGTDGKYGLNILMEVTPEPPGVNCAAGGHRMEAGLDDDGNGELSVNEIDTTFYACHGAASEDRRAALMNVVPEPPGVNCVAGGQRIEVGVDDDGDGGLSANEVNDTYYLCNGAAGADGEGGCAMAAGAGGPGAFSLLLALGLLVLVSRRRPPGAGAP